MFDIYKVCIIMISLKYTAEMDILFSRNRGFLNKYVQKCRFFGKKSVFLVLKRRFRRFSAAFGDSAVSSAQFSCLCRAAGAVCCGENNLRKRRDES